MRIRPVRRRRSDRGVGLAGARQGLGDEAVGLQLLDEVAEERHGLGPAAPGRADRLLDLHEALRDDPEIEVALDEAGRRLPDARARLQSLGEEHVDPLAAADHGGVLQGAREEQVVGRALLHADPYAGTVDIRGRDEARVARDDIDTLDHDVGLGERDGGLAGGVDGEEAEVGPAVDHRVVRRARSIEGEQLHRYPEPRADLAGQVDRDPGRRLRRAPRQHGVAQVDGGAQGATGREVGDDDVGRGAHGRILPDVAKCRAT